MKKISREKILGKSNNRQIVDIPSLAPIKTSRRELTPNLKIPEPTRSLLWITGEDISKISSPKVIKMNISLTDKGVEANMDEGHNFFGEPSLIWTQLPVQRNSELETRPMYYPSYAELSPKHRYQYLDWLRDITQETNLSYAFLYYYGLERHLLVGNYDGAVDEILRLIQYHNKGTFKNYAVPALLVASVFRRRRDILDRAPFLLNEISNEALVVRLKTESDLTAEEVIKLASRVGYINKRYIKLYPDEFEKELQRLINSFKAKYGNILEAVTPTSIEKEQTMVFVNLSIPDNIRVVKLPQLLDNEQFKTKLRNLLSETHTVIKELKRKSSKN